MEKHYLLGMLLLLSSLSMVGCTSEENDLQLKETSDSTVIEGRVYSTNGKPLANIPVKVDFVKSAWLQSHKIRHKAETKTDADGRYRLFFQLKSDEEERDSEVNKSFYLIYDLEQLDRKIYLLPSDMQVVIGPENPPVASLEKDIKNIVRLNFTPKRGKHYTEAYYVPEKRYIPVTLKGINDSSSDYFQLDIVHFPMGLKGSYGQILSLFLLHKAKEKTFQVPFPLNEETTLKLVRQIGGKITTEEIKVLVTEEEPKKLEYEFIE